MNARYHNVTKFTGLNESADGLRELKPGEASTADNFSVTDGYNIRLRPGSVRFSAHDGEPVALWSGYIKDRHYLISAVQYPEQGRTDVTAYTFSTTFQEFGKEEIFHEYGNTVVKLFSLFDTVYIAIGYQIFSVEVDSEYGFHIQPEVPYIPLAVSGSAPSGGGTLLEPKNILTDYARVQYSADGEATAYRLPDEANGVQAVSVDSVRLFNSGAYDADAKTFTFTTAPVKGVNNVEIVYSTAYADLLEAREKFARMPYSEAYNGTTDSRLFFYGDGTNITYYTGVTEAGRGSALYIPAGNEIAVDMSDSPITGAVRHYSRLLFFKPECCAVVSYEPLTLADGTMIAGFTQRTVHKYAGSQIPGPVPLCSNFPRTIADGNLYEWRMPYQTTADERYAKNISAPVVKSLSSADMSRITVCDDSFHSNFYIFLNDAKGTVLVNRYDLGTWTIYKGEAYKGVKYAAMYGDKLVFARFNGNTQTLYYMDESYHYDDAPIPGSPAIAIPAKWCTGYMDFNAEVLKKYSSYLWVSVFPESNSIFEVSAITERQDKYANKEVSANVFDYGDIVYSNWTYETSFSPVMKRIKLKVKKFVYYMLKFEVNSPGAAATILGYDLKIRYGSEVK